MISKARMQPPESPSLTDLAFEACTLEDENGEARARMLVWLEANPRDRKRLMPEIVGAACDHAIQMVRHQGNRAAVGEEPFAPYARKSSMSPNLPGETTESKRNPSAAVRRARSKGERILDLLERSYDGSRIGDKTRDDLLAGALHQRRGSRGSLAKALFMERIAAGLKPNQKVRSRYNNEELTLMYRKARADAAEMVGLDDDEETIGAV